MVEFLPRGFIYRFFIKDKYDIEIACGDTHPTRVIGGSPNKDSVKISWTHMDVIERGYNGFGMKSEKGRHKHYQNYDYIVNVSEECKDKFIQKFGFEDKALVIHNPVPTEDVIKKSLLPCDITLSKNEFNVVLIGRMTPQKGFDRLLEAQKRLVCEGIKQHIYIIGDGMDRGDLEKYIEENNLSDSVTLLGFLENPYNVLKQADLFLVASRDESFCLVLAEAMILGIPVMSTRCTGPTELLENGKNGLLVDNNTDAIYEGLKKIRTDNDVYENLKVLAKNNVSKFNFKEQMAKIEELFDRE